MRKLLRFWPCFWVGVGVQTLISYMAMSVNAPHWYRKVVLALYDIPAGLLCGLFIKVRSEADVGANAVFLPFIILLYALAVAALVSFIREEASASVFVISALLFGLALLQGLWIVVGIIIWQWCLFLAVTVEFATPFLCVLGLVAGIIPSRALHRRHKQAIDLLSFRLSVVGVCLLAGEALLLLLIHKTAPNVFPGIPLG